MYKKVTLTEKRARFALNMQRFATPENTTTSSTLTAEMKTYYDKTLIQNAEPELVHDQFGQTRNIPRNGGKTIEFRKYSSLPKTTTPLTEGVTPSGQSLSVSTITATISQYGGYLAFSDILDLTAIDDNIVEGSTLLGSQSGRTLDTITRNILHSGTNVYYAPSVSTAGVETVVTSRTSLASTCLLRVKDVFRMAALLKAANAKTIDGSYVCIIHPYVAYDLMMDADKLWIDVSKYTDPDSIMKGEIGKLGGVRFVESSEAKIWKDTTCPATTTGSGESAVTTYTAVFGCLFLGANAYGTTELEGGGLETIVKPLGSGGTADPLNQRSTVGWKATKTAELLTSEYMIRFECCSTMDSSVSESN